MLARPKRLAGGLSVTNAVKRGNNASRMMNTGDSDDETYENA